jgi:hypothetical protein
MDEEYKYGLYEETHTTRNKKKTSTYSHLTFCFGFDLASRNVYPESLKQQPHSGLVCTTWRSNRRQKVVIWLLSRLVPVRATFIFKFRSLISFFMLVNYIGPTG